MKPTNAPAGPATKRRLKRSTVIGFLLFAALAAEAPVHAHWDEIRTILSLRWKPPRVAYWHGDINRPLIALTFDDGPGTATEKILDILKEKNVRGTFFLLGSQVDKHPQLARRIVEEGHSIGNHTYSHRDLRRLTDRQIDVEINKSEEAIQRATGLRCDLMRAPYGMVDKRVLKDLEDRGYKVIQWTFSPRDWSQPADQKIIRRVMHHVGNGSIILLHDGSPSGTERRDRTIAALPELIDDLRHQGFQLVTVPELLDVPPTFQVASANRPQQVASTATHP